MHAAAVLLVAPADLGRVYLYQPSQPAPTALTFPGLSLMSAGTATGELAEGRLCVPSPSLFHFGMHNKNWNESSRDLSCSSWKLEHFTECRVLQL